MFAQDAPRYRDAGITTIPIVPGTKRPPVLWQELQSRPATSSEMSKWMENFGAHDTAAVLRGVVDVEEDEWNAADALARDHGLKLPKTYEWASERGRHRMYRCDVPGLRRVSLGKVELRAGGISVVPTSAGRRALTDLRDLAYLPEDVLGFWEERQGSPKALDPSLLSCKTVTVTALQEKRKDLNALGDVPNALGDMALNALVENLHGIFSDPQVVKAVCKVLGVPWGKTFRCILPGHAEEHPSCSIYQSPTGLWIYRDFHQRDGDKVFLIPEVFASLRYGMVKRLESRLTMMIRAGLSREDVLSDTELAVWARRLLWEAGLLTLPSVDMVPLPEDAPDYVRTVYDGFRLLVQIRWLFKMGESVTFSWRFASAWCGVGQYRVQQAMRYLLAEDIIRPSDLIRGPYGKEIATFLPSSVPVDIIREAVINRSRGPIDSSERAQKRDIPRCSKCRGVLSGQACEVCAQRDVSIELAKVGRCDRDGFDKLFQTMKSLREAGKSWVAVKDAIIAARLDVVTVG